MLGSQIRQSLHEVGESFNKKKGGGRLLLSVQLIQGHVTFYCVVLEDELCLLNAKINVGQFIQCFISI